MNYFIFATVFSALTFISFSCKPSKSQLNSEVKTEDVKSGNYGWPPKRMIFSFVEMPYCKTHRIAKIKFTNTMIFNFVDLKASSHGFRYPKEFECKDLAQARGVKEVMSSSQVVEPLPNRNELVWEKGEDKFGKYNLKAFILWSKKFPDRKEKIVLKDYGSQVCLYREGDDEALLDRKNCSTFLYNRMLDSEESQEKMSSAIESQIQ